MKKALFIIALTILPIFAMVGLAQAQPNLGIGYVNGLGLQTAIENDPRAMAISIVRYLMTFLGIIAVIVILYGGFLWLTAGGNEDRVGKAKRTIIAGAIGLVIILAAYAIVVFVINFTGSVLNGSV